MKMRVTHTFLHLINAVIESVTNNNGSDIGCLNK